MSLNQLRRGSHAHPSAVGRPTFLEEDQRHMGTREPCVPVPVISQECSPSCEKQVHDTLNTNVEFVPQGNTPEAFEMPRVHSDRTNVSLSSTAMNTNDTLDSIFTDHTTAVATAASSFSQKEEGGGSAGTIPSSTPNVSHNHHNQVNHTPHAKKEQARCTHDINAVKGTYHPLSQQATHPLGFVHEGTAGPTSSCLFPMEAYNPPFDARDPYSNCEVSETEGEIKDSDEIFHDIIRYPRSQSQHNRPCRRSSVMKQLQDPAGRSRSSGKLLENTERNRKFDESHSSFCELTHTGSSSHIHSDPQQNSCSRPRHRRRHSYSVSSHRPRHPGTSHTWFHRLLSCCPFLSRCFGGTAGSLRDTTARTRSHTTPRLTNEQGPIPKEERELVYGSSRNRKLHKKNPLNSFYVFLSKCFCNPMDVPTDRIRSMSHHSSRRLHRRRSHTTSDLSLSPIPLGPSRCEGEIHSGDASVLQNSYTTLSVTPFSFPTPHSAQDTTTSNVLESVLVDPRKASTDSTRPKKRKSVQFDSRISILDDVRKPHSFTYHLIHTEDYKGNSLSDAHKRKSHGASTSRQEKRSHSMSCVPGVNRPPNPCCLAHTITQLSPLPGKNPPAQMSPPSGSNDEHLLPLQCGGSHNLPPDVRLCGTIPLLNSVMDGLSITDTEDSSVPVDSIAANVGSHEPFPEFDRTESFELAFGSEPLNYTHVIGDPATKKARKTSPVLEVMRRKISLAYSEFGAELRLFLSALRDGTAAVPAQKTSFQEYDLLTSIGDPTVASSSRRSLNSAHETTSSSFLKLPDPSRGTSFSDCVIYTNRNQSARLASIRATHSQPLASDSSISTTSNQNTKSNTPVGSPAFMGDCAYGSSVLSVGDCHSPITPLVGKRSLHMGGEAGRDRTVDLSLAPNESLERRLQKMFDALDYDGKGVTLERLQGAFRDLGYYHIDRQVHNIFKTADWEDRGVISWNDFHTFLSLFTRANIAYGEEIDEAIASSLRHLTRTTPALMRPMKRITSRTVRNYALQTHIGCASRVKCVAVSPYGQWYAASQKDDIDVTIWRRSDMAHQITLYGHAKAIMCVAFSPDLKVIATGSRDGNATLWDCVVGNELAVCPHPGIVTCLGFSYDGTILYTGCQDNIVRSFTSPKGRPLQQSTRPDQRGVVLALAVSHTYPFTQRAAYSSTNREEVQETGLEHPDSTSSTSMESSTMGVDKQEPSDHEPPTESTEKKTDMWSTVADLSAQQRNSRATEQFGGCPVSLLHHMAPPSSGMIAERCGSEDSTHSSDFSSSMNTQSPITPKPSMDAIQDEELVSSPCVLAPTDLNATVMRPNKGDATVQALMSTANCSKASIEATKSYTSISTRSQRWIAAVTRSNEPFEIQVIDGEHLKTLHTLRGHSSMVWNISFNFCGFLQTSCVRFLMVWDVRHALFLSTCPESLATTKSHKSTAAKKNRAPIRLVLTLDIRSLQNPVDTTTPFTSHVNLPRGSNEKKGTVAWTTTTFFTQPFSNVIMAATNYRRVYFIDIEKKSVFLILDTRFIVMVCSAGLGYVLLGDQAGNLIELSLQ